MSESATDGGVTASIASVHAPVSCFRAEGFEWTLERIADLKAFLRLRKTPTQISAIMSCSRSSVLAALVQIGARQRLPDPGDVAEMRADPSRAAPPVKVTLPQTALQIIHAAVDHVEHPIERLTATSCRWPIGTVGSPGFRFCMAAKQADNTPYCRHHSRVAYPGRR